MVDPSVLVAIVLAEPYAETLLGHLRGSSEGVALSAAGLLEATMVVEARQGLDATRDLTLLINGLDVEVVVVDQEVVAAAIVAWRRFGKGRHPASLNFGDCSSYGLAKVRGESLAFKGVDFAQTDIRAAW